MTNLQPIVDLGFQVADSVILTVLVPAIAYFVMRKLHIDTQSALGQRVLTVATNAAALGLARAQSEADAAAKPVDIRNAAVQHALDYLDQAISQKTLTAAKITVPLDAMVEAQVARLQLAPPPAATVVVASSATTTTPVTAAAQ